MAKGDYTINDIYQGGYSSLSPSYGDIFTGYMVKAGSLGLTTDPRTANVLQDVSTKLSTGVKQIELAAVSPEVFESIPKQHLKEINRLSKLTGVDVSVHAPVIEASGITREGFSESNRESAERQMNSAVERSHEVNPNGNIPVTFHSSAIIPQPVKPKGKEIEEEAFAINSETGSISKIPLRERHLTEEKPNIKKELDKANEDSWSSNLSHLSYSLERGSELITHYGALASLAEAEKKAGKDLTAEQRRARAGFNAATAFLNDSYRELKEIYETAYRNAEGHEKKMLDELKERTEDNIKKIERAPTSREGIQLRQGIIEEGLETLNKISPPQIFRPLDEFAKEKTIQTFSNIALNSYNKFKDKAPIISIENPPVGGAFSTGKELKEIVEKSREKFVEKAVEQGMPESEAKAQAEKLLGVTWDVGHINMLRKYGYKAEDIVKETEEVKELIKEVHISDNFGFEHTELPWGMGNVPMKEIMETLPEKDVRKIIEAGSWWQHFKTAPFKETLEATGSSLYSMHMAPYWNQALGLYQGYYGGLAGQWLPQTHYETFGTSFSDTPMELGGQRPGAQGSRMSGRPME